MSDSDRLALRELAEGYALGIDRRDSAHVGSLFAEDATLVIPRIPESLEPVTELRGRERIERAIARVDMFVHTLHAVVGHVVELDGDRASGVVTCLAHHLRPDNTDWVWALRYHDEYVREPDRWRFQRRELWVDWVEERRVWVARPPA